jgi:hypothetical protein
MSVYHPMWDLAALLGGEVILSRALWNRGASSWGRKGRKGRFEVWVICLLWTIIFDTRGK